ncbi:MAG: hypothetical protein CL402_10190 [Acidiferrobacteraceae bacterium]|nr:hypothetical protein [Acidiferrobacteraceae bacterium]
MDARGAKFFRVISWHVFSLVLVVLVLLVLAPGETQSAVMGFSVGVIGNGYAIWKVFVLPKKRRAQNEALLMYSAEFGKLAIVTVLCVAVFVVVDEVRIGGFAIGLLVALITTIVLLALQKTQLPLNENTEN